MKRFYLKAYDTVKQAQKGIGNWLSFHCYLPHHRQRQIYSVLPYLIILPASVMGISSLFLNLMQGFPISGFFSILINPFSKSYSEAGIDRYTVDKVRICFLSRQSDKL